MTNRRPQLPKRRQYTQNSPRDWKITTVTESASLALVRAVVSLTVHERAMN
jgi:hypothetical protein